MASVAFSHTTDNSDFQSSATYTNQSGRFSGIIYQVVATVYDSLFLCEITVVDSVY